MAILAVWFVLNVGWLIDHPIDGKSQGFCRVLMIDAGFTKLYGLVGRLTTTDRISRKCRYLLLNRYYLGCIVSS